MGNCGRIYHIVGNKIGDVYIKGGETMFKGEFSHAIDTKGRLIIPAKMREALGPTGVLTKGFDNCLTIYTQDQFELLTKQLTSKSQTNSKVRAVTRFLLGSATDIEFDKQGRLLVPAALRQHASLLKEAVVVGGGDRIEIWSRERWDLYNEAIDDNIEALVEDLDIGI